MVKQGSVHKLRLNPNISCSKSMHSLTASRTSSVKRGYNKRSNSTELD